MSKKIILITGANKGIGYGLVKGLLNKNKENMHIILTSRNVELGLKAMTELKKENNTNNLSYFKLDIENLTDIRLLESHIKKNYGYLTCLINNAGYFNRNPGFSNEERVEDIIKTFSINFFSQVLLTESLSHLIKKSPHELNNQILFTSSLKGQRRFHNERFNERLNDGSISNLENFYNEYIFAFNNGKGKDFSYKEENQFFSYGTSKMFLNSYMNNLSLKLSSTHIKVNSFNPGWVKTDMGGKNASLSIEEGIDTPIWMIDNYDNIENGRIYEERKVIDF